MWMDSTSPAAKVPRKKTADAGAEAKTADAARKSGIRARGIFSRLQIFNGGYHVAPMRYDLFMRTTVESIVVDAVALGDDWGTTVHWGGGPGGCSRDPIAIGRERGSIRLLRCTPLRRAALSPALLPPPLPRASVELRTRQSSLPGARSVVLWGVRLPEGAVSSFRLITLWHAGMGVVHHAFGHCRFTLVA